MRVKPKLRLLLVAAIGLTTLALATPGRAVTTTCSHSDSISNSTNGGTASDGATCTVEPSLSRTNAAQVYVNDADPDGLPSANIKSLTASTGSGVLTFTITAASNIPTNPSDFVPAPGGTGLIRAPYGGVHYLTLFKTDWLGQVEIIGTNANTGIPTDARGGSPNDNIHWFAGYGLTASEGGVPDCNFGIYDPAGISSNGVHVGGGQVFTTIDQKSLDPPIVQDASKPQISCTVSGKTLTIKIPYVVWTCSHLNAACLAYAADPSKFAANPTTAYTVIGNPGCSTDAASGARPGCAVRWGELPEAPNTFTNRDELLKATTAPASTPRGLSAVYDVKAFSWMDHELGGPQPVGLVFGFTWYTDSVPSSSYDQGILSQDPSVGAFAVDPECTRRVAIGGVSRSTPAGPVNVDATYVKNPVFQGLYGQCYQTSPVGPKFKGGLSFTAA